MLFYPKQSAMDLFIRMEGYSFRFASMGFASMD